MSNKIIVVGSSNTDLVLKTERFPKPGETILGGDFYTFQGGKGANQAVTAARAGGDVTFVCRLGNDTFGNDAINHYGKENIDVTSIFQDPTAPTGVAVITVNGEGENSIIVASGANALLNVEDVEKAIKNTGETNWFITQLETPIEVIVYLAKYAKDNNKNLVLNPAPAAVLSDEVYDGLFLITPNETETELLTGIKVVDELTASQACEIFKAKGVQNSIITLGSKGAYLSTESYTGIIESKKVKAIDTTAAGDVFNGALIVALSEGKNWKEAVEFACKAAAISVTRMGAQTSAPTRNEIDQ
ncbi:ribokinase [Flavobacterium cupreum]|uniref:Ribokinase n=2 Tax=Flavobacterium TaxID=237 RepID=A0A4Y7UDJ5_9FLAO|nr:MULTISPECIES: ribokinase [Flavobacterium]RUT67977.1 ribokinase [Flavobacterium cupreum]TCN59002.1 ribokinase [Flavobacterium circumlabens]TEB44404.1 ribokinase [Flavobacterium circumlabens]